MNKILKISDGEEVAIMVREDGYVNVTQICKASGKQFKNWNSLNNSTEILNALSNSVNMPVSQLLDIKKGNSTKFEQGTYAHPLLAIQIAQWCSPEFAIQVSKWVNELATTGSVVLDETYRKIDKEKKIPIKPQKQYDVATFKHIQRKQEYIYVVTTETYMANKLYKVGKTDNLPRRLREYNSTGISTQNQYFYVFTKETTCANAIEQLLKHYISPYRESCNREMYQINGNLLIDILNNLIDSVNNSVATSDSIMQSYVDKYDIADNLQPIITDEKIFTSREILDMIKNVIIVYITETGKYIINFSDIRDKLKYKLLLDSYADLYKEKDNLRLAICELNETQQNKIVVRLSK